MATQPTVEDVLTFDVGDLGPVDHPVMLVGLTGWFDAAGAATNALAQIAPWSTAVTIGEIDPDPFYDFTQERPMVELVDGDIRQVTWPTNAFQLVRTPGGRDGHDGHDLVVLSGVEPHLAWRTYAECVVHVAEQLRCAAVVTVGAIADAVPHTRLPLVVGSTASAELAGRLGLSSPTYQGITGLVGVLHAELEERGIPTISLRVGVPHYLIHTEHPRAVAALLGHLSHVLAVPIDADLDEMIERWETIHDEAVADDEQLQAYVRMLEADYDRRAEATLREADDLAARFEEFLREQGDDPTD
jgi:proteasome assembly chaperone (PAC2) family protein